MKNKMDIVIAHFNSRSELAFALGVSRPAVSQWIEAGGLPPQRAIQVEQLTNGKIKAVDVVLCVDAGGLEL